MNRDERVPIGAVGLIAPDREHLPACIDEYVAHWQHYRRTAIEFAPHWMALHHPERTVSHLISSIKSARHAA
jgi:hypothetical protein